ncbi:Cation transport ATPase [Giardia duodenalis]|uniref:Cation transport ATPase n=1 Tax=Giardia intestinalis TaxID=5741 RepID=V6TID9_GIAIN|nr:Cation transport ATPase [Giardia intestinalis]
MIADHPATCYTCDANATVARQVVPIYEDLAACEQGGNVKASRERGKKRKQGTVHKVRINYYPLSQRSSNKFRSSPYTPLNFVPLFLKAQFSRPSNVIFVGIMILNYMPGITIVSKATAVIPVVFILATSLLKDLIELGIRIKNDKVINKAEYGEHISGGKVCSTVEAQNINPGDIFKITAGQTAPCDVLVLASDKSVVYFSQSSLTGEQNLVQKNPLYTSTDIISSQFVGDVEFSFYQGKVFGCYTGPAVEENTQGYVSTAPDLHAAPVSVCIEDVQAIQRARERRYRNAAMSTHHIQMNSVVKRASMGKRPLQSEPIVHSILLNQGNVGFKGTAATTDYYALALATGENCMSTYTAHKRESRISNGAKRLQLIIIVQCSLVLVFVISFSSVVTERYQGYIERYPYLEIADQFASKAGAFFISFVSYIILFSYALPICIFVTIELLNILNRLFVRSDLNLIHLYGSCTVNNDKVLADLSRITHIFTDKTGTLTRNQFTYHSFLGVDECRRLSTESILKSIYALGENRANDADLNVFYGNYASQTPQHTVDTIQNRVLQLVALGLCNSLIPVKSNGRLEYFGESVEETCYIRYLSTNGILSIVEKTESTVRLALSRSFIETGNVSSARIQTARFSNTFESVISDDYSIDKYVLLDFELLKVYEFTPSLKRMSVICCQKASHETTSCSMYVVNGLRPFLITKGSHVVMGQLMNRIPMAEGEQSTEQPQSLSIENIITKNLADKRCFVFAFKPFPTLPNVKTEPQQSVEQGSNFLGISVIEDELAPNVLESVKKLRFAGIKINIVTGDSIETTIETAARTGIIDVDTNKVIITRMDEIALRKAELQDEEDQRYCLVVSGEVINEVFPNLERRAQINAFLRKGKLPKKFARQYFKDTGVECSHEPKVSLDLMYLISQANACLFCSMSPESKKVVIQYHSVYTSLQKTRIKLWCRGKSPSVGASLAIGDGQNDLQMIDAADVSVGVRGREGLYVANNADVSVPSFSTLVRLILVHGVLIEQRIRMTIFYNLYKNTMLAIICGFYSGESLFSSVLIINDFLSLMYNVILNFIPIFIYALSEQHVKPRYLENFPTIYRTNCQPWRYWFEFVTFYISGIYMAVIIYFCTAFMFGNSAILGTSGRVADTTVFSFIIITVITFVSLARLMIASNYYSTAFAWSIILSIALYYFTLVGINYTFFFTQYFFNTLTVASASLSYYLQCLVMIIFCLVPDIIYSTLSRLYINPDPNSLLTHYFKKETKGLGKRKDIQLELRYKRCLEEVIRSIQTTAKSSKEQSQNAIFCTESLEVDVKQEYN